MHYLTLFLIAALLTLLPACEKEPLDTLDELLPATQEGANTLGCLIDGEVFYNRGGGFGAQDITGVYGTIPNERIGIVGHDFSSDLSESISLLIVNPTAGIYTPIARFSSYSTGVGLEDVNYFIELNAPYSIVIERFDPTENIISGTFNFTVVDTLTQDRKVITDGRFDVRYF